MKLVALVWLLVFFAIAIAPITKANEQKPDHVQDNEMHFNCHHSGWRYGTGSNCGSTTYRHDLQVYELKHQQLLQNSSDKLLYNYRHCGVVAINNIFPVDMLDSLKVDLDKLLHPLLESRRRIRAAVQRARVSRMRPQHLFFGAASANGIFNEPYLASWDWIRERNTGRLDVTLPKEFFMKGYAPHFQQSSVLKMIEENPIIRSFLPRLLGTNMQLKSMHVLYALNASEGCKDQHWHRDDALLFESDDRFSPAAGLYANSDATDHRGMNYFDNYETDSPSENVADNPISDTNDSCKNSDTCSISCSGSSSTSTSSSNRDRKCMEGRVGDDQYATGADVHGKRDGVHLPPYALNVFIPLTDVHDHNGPTEFTLGSHMWGSTWAEDEQADMRQFGGRLRDEKMTMHCGGVYIADYRTIHRGTTNHGNVNTVFGVSAGGGGDDTEARISPATARKEITKTREALRVTTEYENGARPVLMLIYGRRWWQDATNYEPLDPPQPLTEEVLKVAKERLAAHNSAVRSVTANATAAKSGTEQEESEAGSRGGENVSAIAASPLTMEDLQSRFAVFWKLLLKWSS